MNTVQKSMKLLMTRLKLINIVRVLQKTIQLVKQKANEKTEHWYVSINIIIK